MNRLAYVVLALLVATQVQQRVSAAENFNAVLSKAHKFYEAQISGKQPNWNRMSTDNPGGWRGDSHLLDGKTIGENLQGGFYDAGDFMKAGQSIGWVLSNLALGYIEFKKGYVASGNDQVFMNQFKWGIDWMVKAHVTASDIPSQNKFVGQLSNNLVDHKYLGRPEHHITARPVYLVSKDVPGADVASQYAAAFASAAFIFREKGNTAYAKQLFKHAKQSFAFAKAYPQNYIIPDGVFQAYKTYWEIGYKGHLAYAAAWLCKFDDAFCDEAVELYTEAGAINNIFYCLGYDYDAVYPGASVLLLGMVNKLGLEVESLTKKHLEEYVLKTWEDKSSKCPKQSYANVCYTPKGLAYYSDWGTLRNTGNMMLIAAVTAKYSMSNSASHKCWVRDQAHYITGYTTGRSYFIGHGPSQPQRPHHRGAACKKITKVSNCKLTGAINAAADIWSNGTCCRGESYYSVSSPCCDYINFDSDRPSPITLVGGLVGGPDQSDIFPDIRMDYQRSEVALDFNTGFTVSAAALAAWSADGPMSRICGVAKQAQAEAAPAPMPHVFQPGGVQKPFESAARPPMGPPAGYKRPAAFTA